jgi:hypothetical protein
MLNRGAVIVRLRQPFVDWLRSVEELEEPNIALEQLDKTMYRVRFGNRRRGILVATVCLASK